MFAGLTHTDRPRESLRENAELMPRIKLGVSFGGIETAARDLRVLPLKLVVWLLRGIRSTYAIFVLF